MKKKKTAVVSDVVMKFGGAERVVTSFLEMFPNADLYTLFIVPGARKEIEQKFPLIKIHTSPFQWFIRSDKLSRYVSIIKVLSWLYWEFLNLDKYDLVISSSHSFMSKNVRVKKGTVHLSYIHTPPRYLYNEYNEIGIIRRFPVNIFVWPVLSLLRSIDRIGASRPNILVVNSKNVERRVERYYKRRSTVIYPPVETPARVGKRGEAYVCLSRLVRQKGIDLAVMACAKNNLPLIVVGGGDEMENLKKMAGKRTVFLGNVDDMEKWKILSTARALIYTSKDEDFGIVPVEALKMGIPVIAYNSGGVPETIVDGKNGVLFDDFTIDSLLAAMERLEKSDIKNGFCRESVKKFSELAFKRSILKVINNG